MKPSLTAGLAVGCATAGWMFAEFALGLHDDPAGAGRWTGFLALIFPVLGAVWHTRRATQSGWLAALREGLFFGATGGVVGGAAIYLYHTVVNPGFSVAGRPVAAGMQALGGGIGALLLGALLTMVAHAVFHRRGGNHG